VAIHGYKLIISQAVYHNGKFSHNIIREQIIRQDHKGEPDLSKAKLQRGDKIVLGGYLSIETSDEIIKNVIYLGKGKRKTIWLWNE